ncbi:MAG: methyltransferase domain-containing protein, partial [Clostridiales bacterium]|nr:methyltransferase domain-containing protein [Clostridiales bacterium]
MTGFVCPVCRGNLIGNEKVLRCENGHSYDISRRGYVNLLMSQKSSDFHHGDSKEMVKARSEFLSLGLYEKLCDRVSDIVLAAAKKDMFILDIGCGECYYTEKIAQRVADFSPTVCGIDISKEALIAGAKRDKNINLAVASAFDVPVGDGIADVILNLFAPHDDKEFARIMKPGGTLVRVFPLENHLYELKCAIYEHPYKNEPDGF